MASNGPVTLKLIRFGDEFELDVGAYQLRQAGQPVKLARIPMELLLLLVEQAGQLVTREQIVGRVWGNNVFLDTDNGINAVIRRLRQVLADDPEEPRFIQTVVGRGYRFIAPIEEQDQARSSPRMGEVPSGDSPYVVPPAHGGNDELESGAEDALAPTVLVASRTSPRRRRLLGIGAVTLSLLVLAGMAAQWLMRSDTRVESIAVLPLVNTSKDGDVEYLSDGITEGIINDLSQLPHVRVIARTTVFHYKGQESDPQKVGHDLAVQAVLTGTLSRHRDDVRVQVELIDVRTGAELWGDQYNRKASDIAAVQQEVVRAISENMKIQLTGEDRNRLKKRSTESAEAYDLYLRGRYQWNKFNRESLHKAVAYFQQAIDKDPTYALAYAGLADAYHELSYWSAPQEVMPRSRAAANRALELDDSVAEAHAALGWVKWQYDWDWAGAEHEFQRATELNPNYAIAHGMYALYLDSRSRGSEAAAEHKRALELDPLSLIINSNVGDASYGTRQYNAAITQYQKTLELDENFAPAHDGLAKAFERKGMYREAIAEWQKSLAANGDAQTAADIGQAYATSGYKGAMQVWLDRLKNAPQNVYVSPLLIATLYARLDRREEALPWLAKACAEHSTDLAQLNIEPAWDSLRSDPRYVEVARTMRVH